MAHKKGGGSTRNGRDSNAQRLGVKVFGSEMIQPGAIIVRQRGTNFHATLCSQRLQVRLNSLSTDV